MTLATNQQFDAADFGLQPPPASGSAGSIGDLVWLDSDNSGGQNNGETGLPGIKVKLYRDLAGVGTAGTLDATDPLIATATTGASGQYLFSNLPSGNYLVQVDEAPAP